MIGNDLVDLLCAKQESNWQRPRFLEKLFTPTEITYIENAINPLLAVWSLWSKKESVYKIIARLEKRRFFAPKKIECLFAGTTAAGILPQETNNVVYQNQFFKTTSFFKEHFIHTIAYQESAVPFVLMEDYYIENKYCSTQTKTVRKKLIAAYASHTHLTKEFMSIQKDVNGIPFIYYKDKKESIPISLSHHGNYVGFAIAFEASQFRPNFV